MSETVTITRIGHRGDGIAQTASGPVYVPFALPGEATRCDILSYTEVSRARHGRPAPGAAIFLVARTVAA